MMRAETSRAGASEIMAHAVDAFSGSLKAGVRFHEGVWLLWTGVMEALTAAVREGGPEAAAAVHAEVPAPFTDAASAGRAAPAAGARLRLGLRA